MQNFKSREYNNLFNIFETLAPMSVVRIHFKVAKNYSYLIEEGSTLAKTLLPYLRLCSNFNFIEEKYNFIPLKITQSICQYYMDTQLPLDEGFILFAIEFAPQKLQPVIKSKEDQSSFGIALKRMNYSQESSDIISQNPQNFLWPNLINFLQSLEDDEKKIIKLISKLIIIEDPGLLMPQIIGSLAKREIFIQSLLEIDQIPLSPQQLITILDSLQETQTDIIKYCFTQEVSQQENTIIKSSFQQINNAQQLNDKQISEFLDGYKNVNQNFQVLHIEELTKCSKFIQEKSQAYQHSLFQCALASIIISQQRNLKMIQMPTASGKTWVQGLVAMYYIFQGKKVFIEPNETLRVQTEDLLGSLHADLNISTIQWFYEYPINEYDLIIETQPFFATNQAINGLWILQNRKSLLFSATQNKTMERIMKIVVEDPVILKFQSEFEILTKTTTFNGGLIKTCKDKEEVFFKAQNDIISFYDEKPIIIFCDDDDFLELKNFLDDNQLTKYIKGYDQFIQKQIRSWNYGLLILDSKCSYGINTQFQKDATVLILSQITTEQEYIQMVGRSSRSRGLCSSVYYPITSLNSQQVLEKMKTNNYSYLQNLYYLIKLIYAKRNYINLQTIIENSQKDKDQIKTLKDLEQLMEKPDFKKLTKGFEY